MRRLIVLITVILLTQENVWALRCGKERWHVKTGIDPAAGSVQLTTPKQTTIGKLVAIPRQNVDKNLPEDQRFAPVESTLYTVKATLTGYKLEDDPKTGDSDYHLVLADESGHTMVAEIPDPHCVDTSSPFLAGIKRAREAFTKVFTPTGHLQATETPVTVSGVGFFDRLHGQAGVAPNGIELHPIMDITIGTPSATTFSVPVATVAPTGDDEALDTSTTTGTTTSTAPAPITVPPAAAPKAGELWAVEVLQPYKKTIPKLIVEHDGKQSDLTPSSDVKLNPALSRFAGRDGNTPGTVARLRVEKLIVNDIENISTGIFERIVALLLGVLLLLAFIKALFWGRTARSLVCGKDGAYSKSKVQAALWFGILVVTYVAANALRWYTGGAVHVGGVSIPTHLALLSGISAFTFAAAKGIRVGKENAKAAAGLPANQPVVSRGFFTDLTVDDQGSPDLGDFQLVIITVLAVVIYLVQVWAWLGTIPVTDLTTLPDVDTTILATFGLGQGAYLLKKQFSS